MVLSSSKIVHIRAMLGIYESADLYQMRYYSPNPDEDLGIPAPCSISQMVELFLIFRGAPVVNVKRGSIVAFGAFVRAIWPSLILC